jgi:hypothetical protein
MGLVRDGRGTVCRVAFDGRRGDWRLDDVLRQVVTVRLRGDDDRRNRGSIAGLDRRRMWVAWR